MGRYKKLKMLGEVEAEHLQRQINSLNYRLNALMEEKREADKAKHPSSRSEVAWVQEALAKEGKAATEVKLPDVIEEPRLKRVQFKLVNRALGTDTFAASVAHRRAMRGIGVPYVIKNAHLNVGKEYAGIEILSMWTTENVSELTKRLNEIFYGRFRFYAEVKNV